MKTRATSTPAFWDTPTTSWLPTVVIHIRFQVKTRQSQSYEFKKIAKNSNFEILQETLNATHLLTLLDKMCKNEMDPTRTVGATERKRDVGRTDGWRDGQTDGRTEWNQNTPQQLRCVGGIINTLSFRYNAFENVVYKMTGHFVPSSMRAFIWCLFDNIGFHLLMVLPHPPMISGKWENDETK